MPSPRTNDAVAGYPSSAVLVTAMSSGISFTTRSNTRKGRPGALTPQPVQRARIDTAGFSSRGGRDPLRGALWFEGRPPAAVAGADAGDEVTYGPAVTTIQPTPNLSASMPKL